MAFGKGSTLIILIGFCINLLQVNPSVATRFDYTRGRTHTARRTNGEVKVNFQQREAVDPMADGAGPGIDSAQRRNNEAEGTSRCPGVACMPAPTMAGGKPCRPIFASGSEQCCPTWTCASHSEEDEEDIWGKAEVVNEDGTGRSKSWRYQRRNKAEDYEESSERMGYHDRDEQGPQRLQQRAFPEI